MAKKRDTNETGKNADENASINVGLEANEAINSEASDENASINVGLEANEAINSETSDENAAINAALSADDHISALKALQATANERLATIIATFIALSNALGEDAPATQHALKNLQEYKPEASKVKAPKFNEGKELATVLATASTPESTITALKALRDDNRISDGLNVAITTYVTLAELEGVSQAVIDAAKATLQNFGKKAGRTGISRELFHIKDSKGDVYTTLTGALDGNGIKKGINVVVDGKTRDTQDLAWRTIRPKLLKDGVAEYEGVTYTRVEPVDNAISGQRRQKPAPVETETETEA